MKYKFQEESLPANNSVYVEIKFMDGDGDVYQSEEFLIGSFESFEEIENSQEITEELALWKKIKNTLEPDFNYDDYAAEYGEELADMIDNVPNGPMADYQFKMTVDSIELVYYKDYKKYKSYIYE
jgi:hypothetical protein